MAWAERMVTAVLPDVLYLQMVFSTPKILRKDFLFYYALSRVAYAATREFFAAQFLTIDRERLALIVSPRSFGLSFPSDRCGRERDSDRFIGELLPIDDSRPPGSRRWR